MSAGTHRAEGAIPSDDGTRDLALADPDDANLRRLGIGEATYTILIPGKETAGRYALIDMRIPPASGPPPHRHDFEEMFHVLAGEIQVTLRDVVVTVAAGESINVPALAPHAFTNAAAAWAHLLCFVSPAGLEEYFAEIGDPIESRGGAPDASDGERARGTEKAAALASEYGIELISP